ncbi:MAG TPA: MmcQ/YjbR family DNA-binding protein [Acetobacteraceae bacterium]|nr:MmcQ/YjbR family DNA-binding protein [Acetobacteraceae bacterium]
MAVTPAEFRALALDLPEAVEGSHHGKTDFRLGGTVFATLGHPDAALAVVKLTPGEQEVRVEAEPGIFEPVSGAWGRQGYTKVRLEAADEATMRGALLAAWRNVAPKRLLNPRR